MRAKTYQILRIILIGVVLLQIFSFAVTVQAQSSPGWTVPAKIPGLADSNLDPIFLADSEGTLHLFHSQPVGDNVGIYYIRWTLQQGWSNLVDIINSSAGDARVYGTYLDQEGWLHLIFFGGDDLAADIFYTKAPVSEAAKSSAWTAPVMIGESAITPSTAALVGDENGFLQVIYSGNIKGNGVYSLRSLDGGATWSVPEAMFFTYNDLLWPFALQLALGSDNLVYATWAVKNQAGVSEAVYFAKCSQDGGQWSKPLLIANMVGFQADTPRIIEHQKLLILVYHNDFPTTRWMEISTDYGETWSRPVRLFEQVGSNGAATYAVDSQDHLYMLFGNRIGTPAIHGVWESEWLGDRWGQPEAVVSGPQIRVGPNGEEGFDPSFVQATVIQGNILFAEWRHDPMAGPTNLWFSYRILPVDAIPYQAVPTSPPSPMPVNTATPTPEVSTPFPGETTTPEITPLVSSTLDTQPQSNSQLNNPSLSVLLGIIPVGMLILIAVIVQIRRK